MAGWAFLEGKPILAWISICNSLSNTSPPSRLQAHQRPTPPDLSTAHLAFYPYATWDISPWLGTWGRWSVVRELIPTARWHPVFLPLNRGVVFFDTPRLALLLPGGRTDHNPHLPGIHWAGKPTWKPSKWRRTPFPSCGSSTRQTMSCFTEPVAYHV